MGSYTNPKFVETHASATVRKKFKGFNLLDVSRPNAVIFQPDSGLFFLNAVYMLNEEVVPQNANASASVQLGVPHNSITNTSINATDIASTFAIDWRWQFIITKTNPLMAQLTGPASGYPDLPSVWIASIVAVLTRLSD